MKRVFITGKTKQRHLREARMLSETGGGNMILLNKTLGNTHHIVKIALSHNRHESFYFFAVL